MNLTVSIESAEQRFRQILEDFFVSVYDEKKLHSHGINHHRRVWSYAKEILSLPAPEGLVLFSCDPSKLIIASYMHDIGMSVEPGPKHGKRSMELCTQFLESYNLDSKDYKDLLETIENHDNKEYSSDAHASSLLRILSLADDLDAFGFTGIYRYAEIYLIRGIDPCKAGKLIRENAAARFNNFAGNFRCRDEFLEIHRKRYEILDNFFLYYNKQSETYNFDSASPEGYCGFVQLFMNMLRLNLSLRDFFIGTSGYTYDTIIEYYLRGLKTEFSADKQNE